MDELKNFLLGDYRETMDYIKKVERYGLTKFPPLIISCAITGGMHGKESNPNLPEEPEEQAQQSYDAYNAGASMIHIHARDPINAWATSSTPEAFKKVNALVRAKCPDVIINNTCVGGRRFDEEKNVMLPNLLYSLEAEPEVGSVDITCYSMIRNMKDRKEPLKSPREAFKWNYNYMCTQNDAVRTTKLMQEKGIKPEFEVFGINDLKYVDTMMKENSISAPYWFQMLFGGSGIYPCAEVMMTVTKLLPAESLFSVIGVGACQSAMIALAIALGHHVRVGLEDNLFYGPHDLAKSNAQFVERVVRIAKELGRPIATPAQAREMMGTGGAPQLYVLIGGICAWKIDWLGPIRGRTAEEGVNERCQHHVRPKNQALKIRKKGGGQSYERPCGRKETSYGQVETRRHLRDCAGGSLRTLLFRDAQSAHRYGKNLAGQGGCVHLAVDHYPCDPLRDLDRHCGNQKGSDPL